jgi:hypothetical protein
MFEFRPAGHETNYESIWDDHDLPMDNMDLLQKVHWDLKDGNLVLSLDDGFAEMLKSKKRLTDLPRISWSRECASADK